MTPHSCQTHKQYRLTCEQHEQVQGRADGACERCSVPDDSLEIDHDHALGINAVRGLLCQPCNLRLGRVESGREDADALDAAYLARPWYREHGVTEFYPDNRTPLRAFRVKDELWNSALAVARDRRTTLTSVMRQALVDYTSQHATDDERQEAKR